MYMFFWFFKQLYYCLRRIFKSGLLLLILFFIAFLFIFIKPSFAMDFEFNNNSYNLPDFTDYKYFFIGYDGSSSFPNHYYLWASTVEDYDCFFKYSTFIQNGRGSSRCYYLSLDGTSWQYQSSANKNTSLAQYNQYIGSSAPIHRQGSNDNPYYEPNIFLFVNPSITTTSSSITNWNFTNLEINCGSVPIDSHIELDFNYNNTDYTLDIANYISIENNTIILTIPRNILSNYFVVRSGNSINFKLYVRNSSTGPSTVQYYDLGSYTLDLTAQQEEEINEDSNKDLLHDINNSQQETNNYLQNDNVDNSSITLPSDNSNDITQNGVNSIFNMIYNAFCTGEAQDIVFPIPFTNKNITLQANYIQNMLSDSNATWVITIIQAFWWYLISRFIVKDIVNKINSIKSGNIENIETTNIKGDML